MCMCTPSWGTSAWRQTCFVNKSVEFLWQLNFSLTTCRTICHLKFIFKCLCWLKQWNEQMRRYFVHLNISFTVYSITPKHYMSNFKNGSYCHASMSFCTPNNGVSMWHCYSDRSLVEMMVSESEILYWSRGEIQLCSYPLLHIGKEQEMYKFICFMETDQSNHENVFQLTFRNLFVSMVSVNYQLIIWHIRLFISC